MKANLIAGNLVELKQQFYANPDNVEVVLALANAYADQGRWEEAVEAYKLAIKLDPENGDLYNRLGVVFVALEDPDDAEDSVPQSDRVFSMGCGILLQFGRVVSRATSLVKCKVHV